MHEVSGVQIDKVLSAMKAVVPDGYELVGFDVNQYSFSEEIQISAKFRHEARANANVTALEQAAKKEG